MKLKDIADMETYLKERCYCEGEIYDLTGFFFNIFSPDTPCELLAEANGDVLHGTFVICKSARFNEDVEQILYIEHTDGYVESCVRFDATENNREQVLKYLNGEIDELDLDEFEETNTMGNLEQIVELADAISLN